MAIQTLDVVKGTVAHFPPDIFHCRISALCTTAININRFELEFEPSDSGRKESLFLGERRDTEEALGFAETVMGGFTAASDANADRSEQARATDNALKAETTTDFEKWNQNKDEYDYPSIDTPPLTERF